MPPPSRPKSTLAKAKTMLSAIGSIAATAVVARTVIQDFLPPEFRGYLFYHIRNVYYRFTNEFTLVIHEFAGIQTNELYEAARIYLGPKSSPTTRRLSVIKPLKEKSMNLAVEQDEELVDEFAGRKFTWTLVCRQSESRRLHHSGHVNSIFKEQRSFELTFNKNDKDLVMESYLPYIIDRSKEMKLEKKTLKIYTVDYDYIYDLSRLWLAMNLDHPATFDTLAMDPIHKETIMKDLERFVKRRDHYRKVGKAWKRGYLLYGPPGTGKSSLIAAMANYLNYDIYDLELTEMESNSDLRRVLLATANKSILVVEDIDCTIEIEDRSEKEKEKDDSKSKKKEENENQVTLSGLLNFVDGLWSSCGDERILVFTTNHKEKLDPALLRPGRMDVHIHLSYCTPSGFKLLAENYHGIQSHRLFGEIEELIESTQVTPAEVAEQLLKEDETDSALAGLVGFLHEKKQQLNEEPQDKKVVESESDKKKGGESESDKKGGESESESAEKAKPTEEKEDEEEEE